MSVKGALIRSIVVLMLSLSWIAVFHLFERTNDYAFEHNVFIFLALIYYEVTSKKEG